MRKFLYLFIPSVIIIIIIWWIHFTAGNKVMAVEGTIDFQPVQKQSWQEIITWIIGSLNGLFGIILLVKKVFTKSK
ncbi:hypothetical protein ACFLS4_02595 [Bacteroidota bacterium]